jgi:hypothetical protein
MAVVVVVVGVIDVIRSHSRSIILYTSVEHRNADIQEKIEYSGSFEPPPPPYS